MKSGRKINYDLENFPLHIKTDSLAGSTENVSVHFSNAEGNLAGAISIYFNSPAQYRVYPCTNKHSDFPSSLPSVVEKTWRIALKRTPDIRVLVQCNGVDVVNELLSDSKCGNPNWSTFWSRDVKRIFFITSDTASDLYLSYPGDSLMIFDKFIYHYHGRS